MNVIIDNYDSFTFNLVQYIGENDSNVVVYKNDEVSVQDLIDINPSKIIISPGPGHPKDSGVSVEIVKEFYDKIPILGVCLGHQIIGLVFSSGIANSLDIYHGKASEIYHNSCNLFTGIPSPFNATRYHSLIIDRNNLSRNLSIIAETKDAEIMGIKHKKYPVYGVQFHPESILTKSGMQIIRNFLSIE